MAFGRGVVQIRQASYQRKTDTPAFGKPKTKKSNRVIEISPSVIKTLKAHRKEQAKWMKASGESWRDHNLVCCLQDGRPINPPTLSGVFEDKAAKLGLFVTFHGLRHTHTSLLVKAGVPVKVISERLGHSSVAMTMDIYSHILPGMGRDAANKLEELLNESL